MNLIQVELFIDLVMQRGEGGGFALVLCQVMYRELLVYGTHGSIMTPVNMMPFN